MRGARRKRIVRPRLETSDFGLALRFILKLGGEGRFPLELSSEDEFLLRDLCVGVHLDEVTLQGIADAEVVAGVLERGERPQRRLCASFTLEEFLALMRLLEEGYMEMDREEAFGFWMDLVSRIEIEQI